MEMLKELRKKLQCQRCEEFYNEDYKAFLHVECGHHTCEACNDMDDECQCPVCERVTELTEIPFLEDFSEMLENLAYSIEKFDEVEQQPRNENRTLQFKCAECETSDSEQNLQLCQTCNELKFQNLEDVKKNALCSTCAIKKHIRQGHQIVDFYPYLSAYNFSSHSSNIDSKSEDFKNSQDSLSSTFSHFQALSVNVTENYDNLTDMAQRSKSTKNQVEFFEKMEKFINESKLINVETDSEVKKQAAKMEANLKKIKEWYESKTENCVDESEIIKLPNSDDSNEDVTEVDA